ncbi:MAG: phosphoribosyltransferase [Wolinella sp.]
MREVASCKKDTLKNRDDALSRLIELMPIKKMQKEKPLVVAISSGGILFAHKLAQVINAPFDFLFTQAIPSPHNPECDIAMISETYDIVIHEALTHAFDISLDYIYGEAQRQYEEKILKYIYKFRKGETISSLKGEHILLVDEGIDSGLTITTSVKACITQQAKSVSVASPVMPYDVAMLLEEITDEIYCVLKPQHFVDVETYYDEIEPVDEGVMERILSESLFKNLKQR